MKTSVMEVHDMLSVLSIDGVEKRIGEVPGVESVTVNFAAGNATVRYDETRLDIADIRSDVRQSGYKDGESAATSASEGHATTGAQPEETIPPAPTVPVAAPPSTPAATSATPATPAGQEHQHKVEPEKSQPAQ